MTNPTDRPVLSCCKLLNLLRKLGIDEEHDGPAIPPEKVLGELEEELEAHSNLEAVLSTGEYGEEGRGACHPLAAQPCRACEIVAAAANIREIPTPEADVAVRTSTVSQSGRG